MARAYANTVFYSFTGTAMALIVMSLFAYVLSLKDFKARNKFAFYAFFTTMFSAGLVPAYFVNVRLLHLGDTIWIFLLQEPMFSSAEKKTSGDGKTMRV